MMVSPAPKKLIKIVHRDNFRIRFYSIRPRIEK